MSTTPILFHLITISMTSILRTSIKRVTVIISIIIRTATKRIIHGKLRKLYVIDDNVDKRTFHTYIMEQCDADVQIVWYENTLIKKRHLKGLLTQREHKAERENDQYSSDFSGIVCMERLTLADPGGGRVYPLPTQILDTPLIIANSSLLFDVKNPKNKQV